MAEEDQNLVVVVIPKFDMPHHLFKLTSLKVKSITKVYGIPLELHPKVPLEGMTMNELPERAIGLYDQFLEFSGVERLGKGVGGKIFQETFSGMKGWKGKFFFINRRAILDAMACRHHDSDVYDPLPDDDYCILHVRTLVEKDIDLRSVHLALLIT
nr:hypothetical protein [Tanacetum cinerariifolium]